jgi:hypothetical protein
MIYLSRKLNLNPSRCCPGFVAVLILGEFVRHSPKFNPKDE